MPREIRATFPADVRHRYVVAGMALIVLLVTVAVPGSVGSEVPSPEASLDPGLFQRVEITALERGMAMTILPQDPGSGAAGTLDQATALVDPAFRGAPRSAPVRPAQPTATAGSISKNPWRHDLDISWYGAGLYGHRTACGLTLTRTLVGVAHRSLPCGTLVTFRYNGVTLTVPVIDRGPYVNGRTWDLSAGACAKLNHCFTGTIDWKLAGS
jgi:hypothetical protein